MFMGEHQHTIDNKGRMIIPARFREELGERFVMTKGLEGCLALYPLQEWSVLEQKMRSLPFTRKDARALARFIFSGASECEIDKQGRILIPNNLREHAKLVKDVVVIGVSSRVEIWSKAEWEAYSNETAVSVEEIAEKIVDFDLGF
ncbi:MraZ protein [Desulfofarcimen acetoxidans DSM 771]|jgi:MraZ protein|uniref:Transcriptional regulator MraZ n=1 Tax=Desulfofarcimen acetoxidans (strain ATCC 49208 / DSM 771 / KCTC 5769 / VKM B-1644 / 5575) TaxID=485916 RepID=C8W463_DESAS|nr:division/cell wall cluster transcriptional repressor MraZ [Desulfofarcimen acetoxidans]ACV61931.1 MraZ protein [Desulfofarcimen acetoxidans DSM 771]